MRWKWVQHLTGEPNFDSPIAVEKEDVPLLLIREADIRTSGSVRAGRVIFTIPLVPILRATGETTMVVFPRPLHRFWLGAVTLTYELVSNVTIADGTGSLVCRLFYDEIITNPTAV